MALRFIENRSEIGAGTRGASMGIDALRVASLNAKSDFFTQHPVTTIQDENHLLFKEVKYPKAKRIEGIAKVFQRIAGAVSDTLKANDFPVVLAADHSSAAGTISGIKEQYPNKRLGVVWIDAHADLHSPYTSPSGNIHGMPLAAAIGTDNLQSAVKEVGEEVKEYWNELKNCGGVSPKINAQDIVFFGVRDTESPEDDLIEREGIKNFTVDETREKGFEVACKETLERLKDCDLIYVSFDVDSMDCDKVSMGTGTPVKDGFLPEEALEIISCFTDSDKLVCFEMVEINPTLDNKTNRMAEVSFDILEKVTEKLEKKGL